MTKKYHNSLVKKNSKEIGSYFSLSEDMLYEKNDTCLCMPKEYSFLSTCRSAIDMCLKQINANKKIALLPSFTCHAVVEPFIKNEYLVIPYKIKKNFEIDIEALLNQLEVIKPTVVLVHDYFGINTNRNINCSIIERECKKKSIHIIVDRTQSMFSTYKQLQGEFYVGSIRKWLGIPDGAFVNIQLNIQEEDKQLIDSKCKAMIYKNNYIEENIGNKEILLKQYNEAEKILDSRRHIYKMSTLSQKIISNTSFDYLREVRRRNYELLSNGISEDDFIKIPYKKLCKNEVPFYFPIFIQRKRAELQKYLAKNNVYATVIWACPDIFIEKIDNISNQIYKEILCIPCDQRYTEEDMKYIVGLIMNFNKEIKHE